MSGIEILIDIRNSKEILVALLKIFQSKQDWTIDTSAFIENHLWTNYPNGTAKYFSIDLEKRQFEWAAGDSASSTEGKYQAVNTVEDAIAIAEFAIANADTFKCEEKEDSPTRLKLFNNQNYQSSFFDRLKKLSQTWLSPTEPGISHYKHKHKIKESYGLDFDNSVISNVKIKNTPLVGQSYCDYYIYLKELMGEINNNNRLILDWT